MCSTRCSGMAAGRRHGRDVLAERERSSRAWSWAAASASAGIDAGSYRGYLRRMKVGTKELKNRLSHYLRLVREGEHVQVTDRGAIVAELRPARPATTSDEACLDALEEEGLARKGKKGLDDFAPMTTRGTGRLSAMIMEDRE